MKLLLVRDNFGPECTIGKLYVDNKFQCLTLEDVDRNMESGGVKIPGETCIPRGEYEVVITYSNRFKKDLPLLKNVPQFDGIRIHPGNTHEDTEGCILVGTGTNGDFLFNSRVAFSALFEKLEQAYERGEYISIEVK